MARGSSILTECNNLGLIGLKLVVALYCDSASETRDPNHLAELNKINIKISEFFA